MSIVELKIEAETAIGNGMYKISDSVKNYDLSTGKTMGSSQGSATFYLDDYNGEKDVCKMADCQAGGMWGDEFGRFGYVVTCNP